MQSANNFIEKQGSRFAWKTQPKFKWRRKLDIFPRSAHEHGQTWLLSTIGMVLGQLFTKRFSKCLFTKMAGDSVASMRTDYNLGRKLDADELEVKNPISLFEIWFDEAKNTEGIGEANAMTLATSTKWVSALLTHWNALYLCYYLEKPSLVTLASLLWNAPHILNLSLALTHNYST